MNAAIFSTGDELITGKTLDTNAHWLINQLTELNVDVVCQIDVGDVKSEIRWALESATSHAELVVMTGGLGPTDDDLTRFVLAEMLGVELRLNEHSLQQIEIFFASRNRSMPKCSIIPTALHRASKSPSANPPSFVCPAYREK